MNEGKGRYIHSHLSCRQIPDLLQSIFVGEILKPSRSIWLVSPWISDINVLDNTANQLSGLEASWTCRRIHLSEILIWLAGAGTKICVVTRPDQHNQHFLGVLREWQKANSGCMIVHEKEELHEKGMLGDYYYLSGSMNFTYNGITLNQEAVHFETDSQIVAENRLVYAHRWGGQ